MQRERGGRRRRSGGTSKNVKPRFFRRTGIFFLGDTLAIDIRNYGDRYNRRRGEGDPGRMQTRQEPMFGIQRTEERKGGQKDGTRKQRRQQATKPGRRKDEWMADGRKGRTDEQKRREKESKKGEWVDE
jgi:hypothetical protein